MGVHSIGTCTRISQHGLLERFINDVYDTCLREFSKTGNYSAHAHVASSYHRASLAQNGELDRSKPYYICLVSRTVEKEQAAAGNKRAGSRTQLITTNNPKKWIDSANNKVRGSQWSLCFIMEAPEGMDEEAELKLRKEWEVETRRIHLRTARGIQYAQDLGVRYWLSDSLRDAKKYPKLIKHFKND